MMLAIVVGLTISYVIQISDEKRGLKYLEIEYLEYLEDTILRQYLKDTSEKYLILYLQDTFENYFIFYLQDTFKKYLAHHCSDSTYFVDIAHVTK